MKIIRWIMTLLGIILVSTSHSYADEFDWMSPGVRSTSDNSIVSGDLSSNEILLSRSGGSDPNQTSFDVMIATGFDDDFDTTIVWSGSVASGTFMITGNTLYTGIQYYRRVISRVSGGPDIVSPILGFIIYPEREIDCRKRIFEGRRNIGSMNRAQQAYYLEQNFFAPSLSALAIGVPETSSYYQYSTLPNNSHGYTINQAQSLQAGSGGLSIIGMTRLLQNGPDLETRAVLCSLTGTINLTGLHNILNTGSYPTTINRTCDDLGLNDETTNPTGLACPFDDVLNQLPAPRCMEVTKLRPAKPGTPALCIEWTGLALGGTFSMGSVISLLFDYKNTTLNPLSQQRIERRRLIPLVPADFVPRTSSPVFFKIFKSDPAPLESQRRKVE